MESSTTRDEYLAELVRFFIFAILFVCLVSSGSPESWRLHLYDGANPRSFDFAGRPSWRTCAISLEGDLGFVGPPWMF